MRDDLLVRRFEDKDFRLSIYQEECPESPRKDDNLGTMVCFHDRYDLGDENHGFKKSNFTSWAELKNAIETVHNAAVILPLHLYDHSGLCIKVGSFQGLLPGYHAEFDSGPVGFIFVSRDKVLKEYGAKKLGGALKAKVERVLKGEVETYDQYLQNDIYGFVLEKRNTCDKCKHEEWEHIDSCWGFYGYDIEKNGIKEHLGEYEYMVDEKYEVKK